MKATINEEEKCRRLKEDIKMMKSQKCDAEKDKLIEEDKLIGISKIIRLNDENPESQKKLSYIKMAALTIKTYENNSA